MSRLIATTAWLAFSPRDTVFVRDGRSFDAATDAFALAVRPSPTTVAGAVGAAFGEKPLEVRGPVLARRAGADWIPYFPVPADLVVTDHRARRVYRLRPQDSDRPRAGWRTDLDSPDLGGTGPDGANPESADPNGAISGSAGRDGGKPLRMLMPPAHVEQVKPVSGEAPGRLLMPATVLAEYLAGRLPGEGGTPLGSLRLAEPLMPEQRVGLAREKRRAREGFLYQAVHLRPDEDWAFLAQYAVGEKQLETRKDHVPFGGRGRLADVEPAAMSWPDATQTIGRQVVVYLATQAVWRDGWRLPVPRGAELVAAATYEPEPVATVKPGREWRASRALRWAVPAGSVYLLEFGDAAAGAAWARKWNGVALDRRSGADGEGTAEEEDLLRTAGFGVVLTGAWT